MNTIADSAIPQIPFLVATAERPVDDDECIVKVDTSESDQVFNVSWFHTRCGHPRHRDD